MAGRWSAEPGCGYDNFVYVCKLTLYDTLYYGIGLFLYEYYFLCVEVNMCLWMK